MPLFEPADFVEVKLKATNSAATNTSLIEAAMSGGNKRLLLPVGQFDINDIVVTGDNLVIRGAGVPMPNVGRTALANGTILKGGALNLNQHTGMIISDLGFDSTVAGTYAIYSGDSATGEQNVHIENVSALGRSLVTSHAFYFTAGNNVTLRNCRAYKFDHGFAIRTGYVHLSDCYVEDCAVSSLTLKGIHDYDAFYNAVVNFVAIGTTLGAGGPVIIEGHDGRTAGHVALSNLVLRNLSRGILIKSAVTTAEDGYGLVTDVNIANVAIHGTQFEAILVQNPSVTYVNVAGVTALSVGSTAFNNTSDSTTVRLGNCWTTAASAISGYFQRAQVNGRELAADTPLQNDYNNRLDAVVHAIKNSLTTVSRMIDTFTTDRSAGAVIGTAAQAGPGNRVVTDSGSKLSLSGGACVWTSGVGNYDPAISWTAPVVRFPGRVIRFSLTLSANRVQIGLLTAMTHADIANARRCVIDYLASNVRIVPSATITAINAETFSTGTYVLTVILRRQGAFYLVKGGSFTDNQILFIDNVDATETLYPFVANIGTTTSVSIADVSTLDDEWSPTPTASDGFASWGTTNGLGHREGIEATAGSGGSGLTWTAQVGTWATASGRACASALTGGIALATVPVAIANVVARVKAHRSAGNVGLALRWTDSSNHLRAYIDGTNCRLDQVLSGTVTNLISAAVTYVAGAEIMVIFAATGTARLYYNGAYVGITTSVNGALTGTAHGLYATDTGNAVDDFAVWARGTGAEHAALDSV